MKEEPREKAERPGIPCIRRHIFLCCGQTKPKCVDREASLVSWAYLKRRLKELRMSGAGGVYRTMANCLQVCRGGPVAVVYPEGAGITPARPRYWSASFKST